MADSGNQFRMFKNGEKMGLCVPRSTTAVKNMTNVTTYYGLMYFTHYCQDDMHDFNLLPPVQRSYGKVMFLQCLSFCWGGVLCDHYPRCFGPHYTGPPQPQPCSLDIWHRTPSRHGTWNPRYPTFRHGTPPAGDIWWASVETCSN